MAQSPCFYSPLPPLCPPCIPFYLLGTLQLCQDSPPQSQVACKLTPFAPPFTQPTLPLPIPGNPTAQRLTRTTSGIFRLLLSGTVHAWQLSDFLSVLSAVWLFFVCACQLSDFLSVLSAVWHFLSVPVSCLISCMSCQLSDFLLSIPGSCLISCLSWQLSGFFFCLCLSVVWFPVCLVSCLAFFVCACQLSDFLSLMTAAWLFLSVPVSCLISCLSCQLSGFFFVCACQLSDFLSVLSAVWLFLSVPGSCLISCLSCQLSGFFCLCLSVVWFPVCHVSCLTSFCVIEAFSSAGRDTMIVNGFYKATTIFTMDGAYKLFNFTRNA